MNDDLTTVAIKKTTHAKLVEWINNNATTPKDTTFEQAILFLIGESKEI